MSIASLWTLLRCKQIHHINSIYHKRIKFWCNTFYANVYCQFPKLNQCNSLFLNLVQDISDADVFIFIQHTTRMVISMASSSSTRFVRLAFCVLVFIVFETCINLHRQNATSSRIRPTTFLCSTQTRFLCLSRRFVTIS